MCYSSATHLPNPCIDHGVYQYWHRDRVGDLEWRESADSAQPIATSEIFRGDVVKYPTAWAPTTVHYYDCLYLFGRSSRAQSRMSSLVLDTHLDASYMQHCLNIIMNTPE